MPRFCANLSLLFPELPFLDRFAAAARCGFRAVECQFPYAWPAAGIAEALRANGLEMVLHNLPAGDWAGGERGIACLPGREAEFQDGLERALAYARTLQCPRLNCLAGVPPTEADAGEVRHTFVRNLRLAAERAAKAGILLLTEPINRRDIPGFWLHRSDQAEALLAEVGHPNLRIQYDIYHAQRSEGELAGTLERMLARIGHIQLADNPGRHEPGTGEIAFPFLFDLLDRIGYAGWVGCEYIPQGDTAAGLAWAARWLESAGAPAAGTG